MSGSNLPYGERPLCADGSLSSTSDRLHERQERLHNTSAQRPHRQNILQPKSRLHFSATQIATCLIVICVLFTLIFSVDTFMHHNTMYHGVAIGEVNVSNMTKEEATAAVHSFYDAPFSQNQLYIFADKETQERYEKGEDVFSDEQINEDTLGSSHAWVVSSDTLQATLDVSYSVDQAFLVGKGLSFRQRFECWLKGISITPEIHIPNTVVESIARHINNISGIERIEHNVSINQGIASVLPGRDGIMVDNNELLNNIVNGLVDKKESVTVITPELYNTPVSYPIEVAQTCADTINRALAYPVNFTIGQTSFELSTTEVGSWVTTEMMTTDDVKLIPVLKQDYAASQLMHYASEMGIVSEHSVTFDTSSDEVIVRVSSEGEIPQYQTGIELLETSLFSTNSTSNADTSQISIVVPYAPITDALTFDEARRLGVISQISSYTTEYTADDLERNFNIHHMADKLNNSVNFANSSWSMLKIAGEIGESTGYKQAGQIVDGLTVKDFGGGVCQVATTVFNAVYESGYPISVRHNHSLYMSTYPDGRDAAIAWPDLDLAWKNNTASDVLVTTSYTDTTVSVYLWGVNQGYTISSTTSAWEPSDAFKIKVTYDPAMKEKKDHIEKKGQNGKSITVTRTIFDRYGNLISEDTFTSTYDPVNQIVIRPGEGDTEVISQGQYDEMIEKEKQDSKKKDGINKKVDDVTSETSATDTQNSASSNVA